MRRQSSEEPIDTPAAPGRRAERPPWWRRILTTLMPSTGASAEERAEAAWDAVAEPWSGEALALLEAARRVAVERDSSTATVADLFEAGREILNTAMQGDEDAVKKVISFMQSEDGSEARLEVGGRPSPSQLLKQGLARARIIAAIANLGEEERASSTMLLALTWRFNPIFAGGLDEMGISWRSLALLATHGVPEVPTQWPDVDGVSEAAIVLRNDSFSTQEDVVDVLHDVLGLERPQAVELMLRVHAEGSATLLSGESEAMRALARQLIAATSASTSLWFEVRAVAD